MSDCDSVNKLQPQQEGIASRETLQHADEMLDIVDSALSDMSAKKKDTSFHDEPDQARLRDEDGDTIRSYRDEDDEEEEEVVRSIHLNVAEKAVRSLPQVESTPPLTSIEVTKFFQGGDSTVLSDESLKFYKPSFVDLKKKINAKKTLPLPVPPARPSLFGALVRGDQVNQKVPYEPEVKLGKRVQVEDMSEGHPVKILPGVGSLPQMREGDPEEEEQIAHDAQVAKALQAQDVSDYEDELAELDQEMRENFSLAGYEDYDSWVRWAPAYAQEACKGIRIFQNVFQDEEAIKSPDYCKIPAELGTWYKGPFEEMFNAELSKHMQITEDPPAKFNKFGVRVYETNPKGLHIIMRCQDILEVVKTHMERRGNAYTEVHAFDGEILDPYFPYWKYIKAVPEFINYITSEAFKQEYNDKVSGRSDQQKPSQSPHGVSLFAEAVKKANPNSQVDRMIHKPLFGSEEWSYVWSIEGLGKARETKKEGESGFADLKFLHAHIIIVRRGFENSVNMRTAERCKNVLIEKFGSKITVVYVNSRNQLKYIGKEKLVVGSTLIVSPIYKPNLFFGDNLNEFRLTKFPEIWNSFFYALCAHLYGEVVAADGTMITSATVARNTGPNPCPICLEPSVEETMAFGHSFGWNREIATNLLQTKCSRFLACFPDQKGGTITTGGLKSFDNFVFERDARVSCCADRAKSIINSKVEFFQNYLINGLGIDKDHALTIMRIISCIFTSWACPIQAPGAKVTSLQVLFAKIQTWIKTNFEQTEFRCVFVLGGAGSTGKTTLAYDLVRGLGFSGPKKGDVFSPKGVGRNTYLATNLCRLYDDVHSGQTSSAQNNVYFNFAAFESNETRLYQESIPRKAVEFNFCTSVEFGFLPNYSEWAQWVGLKHANRRDYDEFVSQIKRRFIQHRFDGPEDFLLPYSRFMLGQDSYIGSDGRIAYVGFPGWGR